MLNLQSLSSLVVPPWVKWVAAAALVASVYGYGYIKGLDHGYQQVVLHDTKLIVKAGKVTTKIVTKYIKQKEVQDKIDETIKQEGSSYAIQFPDGYKFNNEYVRLFNGSVLGTLSPLPSGDPSEASTVSVPEELAVSINNNVAGRQWKERALTCESWAKEQEESANK